MPVRQRLMLYGASLRGLIEIFQPYADAASKGANRVRTELILLQAFMLRAREPWVSNFSDEAARRHHAGTKKSAL